MTRREELIEAYEDAYFALIMDEVAQMEGEKLEQLNQELKANPAAAVPEPVDRRCIQTINHYFAKQRWHRSLQKTRRVINQSAFLLAVISLLFTSALAVSEDLRLTTANWLITVSESYTEFHMQPVIEDNGGTSNRNGSDDKFFSKVYIGWLPDGFFCLNNTYNSIASFENGEGAYISVEYTPGTATYQIDTEDADSVENFEVNGYPVLSVVKDNTTNMVLLNKQKSCLVSVLLSKEIPSDTGIKILENILFF